jgi:hypothetical protein
VASAEPMTTCRSLDLLLALLPLGDVDPLLALEILALLASDLHERDQPLPELIARQVFVCQVLPQRGKPNRYTRRAVNSSR